MKFILTTGLLFLFLNGFSQRYATTEDGRKVILYDDSTWSFVVDEIRVKDDTSSLRTVFKPATANKFIASAHNDFGVWIDDKKWEPSKEKISPVAEYIFINKGTFPEAFSMLVNERVPVSFELLRNQIIKNVQEKLENFQLQKEEYLTVNNLKVLHLIFSGETQGVKLTYTGYYTSDDSGTTQVICFTTVNLFKEYEKLFDEFLNGLSVKSNSTKE